jgi:hypothetical protein
VEAGFGLNGLGAIPEDKPAEAHNERVVEAVFGLEGGGVGDMADNCQTGAD